MENQENSVDYENLNNKIDNGFKATNSSTCLMFSPTHPLTKRESLKLEKEIMQTKLNESVLICAKFQNALWLEFGNVQVKSNNSLSFKLQNPNKIKSVLIELDGSNDKYGLSITLGDKQSSSIEIPPNEHAYGTVQWIPPHDVSMREVLKLKMDQKAPLQLTIHGIAGTGKEPVVTNTIINPPSTATLTERRASIKGRATPQPTKRKSMAPTTCASDSRMNYRNVDNNVMNKRASCGVGAFPDIPNLLNTEPITVPSLSSLVTISTTNTTTAKVESKRKDSIGGLKTKKSSSIPTLSKAISPKGKKIHSYDDNWAEKQTNSFTDWINFTFSQAQIIPHISTLDSNEKVADHHSSINDTTALQQNIDSDSTAYGLRELMQRRVDAKIRQEGVTLLHHSNLKTTTTAIELEVTEGRLLMRSDKDIHSDLGLQESLFELIYCYEFPWMRLGLEVVFGEVMSTSKGNVNSKTIKMSNNSSGHCVTGCLKWKNAFKAFIFENLLNNTTICAQFAKQKLLYVAQEKKMKDLLRRHFLKKFLTLILFLDTARTTELMPKACLFQSNALYKSSKDIITAFCRTFLRGEGDILRHLGLLGYQLNFTQSYVDEFDYTLKNMALELRDGVRLVRLMELLTKTRDLSTQLRVPAVSRLQKLHNIGLVLNRLYRPTDPRPDAKQIVDGNRDMTLMLLWKMLYTYELRNNTSPTKVYEEISAIRSADSWRRSVYGAEEGPFMAVKVPTLQADGTIIHPAQPIHNNLNHSSTFNPEMDEKSLGGALLLWCQTIVEKYEVPVFDLTTCMADGRALCLLVHYYHPSILPTKLIRKTTAHLMESCLEDVTLDAFTETSSSVSNEAMSKALQGERRNYWTLRKACNGIGGIPFILPEFDSRNVPEEKTMIVFLGYLFSRLIESSCQVRAAIRIQRMIRCSSHKFSKRSITTERSITTLTTKNSLKNNLDVTLINNEVEIQLKQLQDEKERLRKEKKSLLKLQKVKVTIQMCPNHASTMIQRTIRSYITRKNYLQELEKLKSLVRTNIEDSFPLEDLTPTYEEVSELVDMFDEEPEAEIETSMIEEMMEELVITPITTNDTTAIIMNVNEASDKHDEEVENIAKAEVQFIINSAFSNHMLKNIEHSMNLKLEYERRGLMFTELKMIYNSRCKVRQLAALKELEATRLIEETKLIAEREKAEALRRTNEAEEERIARELAESRILEEIAARNIIQERLNEIENLRRLEHEVALAAEEEKQRRELAWLREQELIKEERLKQKEDELIRIQAEYETRRIIEENVEKERIARILAEERMESEILARQALEAKLLDIEHARKAIEQEIQRKAEEARLLSIKKEEAVLTLQFYWRAYATYNKKMYTLQSICKIQAYYRGHMIRKQMKCSILAVSIIQNLWRRRQCNKVLTIHIAKTIQIQSFWKGYICRKMLLKQNKSVVLIARSWKMHRNRNHYLKTKHSIVIIQSLFRRNVFYRNYIHTKNVSIKIQSMIRLLLAKTIMNKKRKAMLMINNFFKQIICKRNIIAKFCVAKCQEKLNKIRTKIMKRIINKHMLIFIKNYKCRSAATLLVRWYKSRRPIILVRKLIYGFRRLQAVYKAISIRSKSKNNIIQMRKRIQQSEIKARADPSLRLGKQTIIALQTLQNGKMISHLLKACQILELSTQLSRYCCESFAKANAASILFGLLRSCNRSTPHQELLRIALIVLLNVGRHAHLATILAHASDSTDALIDLMQMFRDKKSIFILASELLARLIDASPETKNICNQPIIHKRLEGIVHIIERKHRLEVRVRSVGDIKSSSIVAPSPSSSISQFDCYKGKSYQNLEPINCIQHIMSLLQN